MFARLWKESDFAEWNAYFLQVRPWAQPFSVKLYQYSQTAFALASSFTCKVIMSAFRLDFQIAPSPQKKASKPLVGECWILKTLT